MQMKITMKYTYTPIKMAKSRTLPTLDASKDTEHHLLLVGLQDGIGNLEDSLVASYRTIFSPINPAITLLGTYPKEL